MESNEHLVEMLLETYTLEDLLEMSGVTEEEVLLLLLERGMLDLDIPILLDFHDYE